MEGNGAPAAAPEKVIDIVTPQAGESVSEGTILEWHKQPGDAVAADETIVEISTDKVDVELPAPASGTLIEILAPEGETVGVGQVIARMAAGDGAPASAPAQVDGPAQATSTPAPEAPDGAKASPVARRAAAAAAGTAHQRSSRRCVSPASSRLLSRSASCHSPEARRAELPSAASAGAR